MALQLGALRAALKSADVPDDLADKAASEVADEKRLAGLDVKLEEIKGSIRNVQSLVAVVLAGIAALILKAFFT